MPQFRRPTNEEIVAALSSSSESFSYSEVAATSDSDSLLQGRIGEGYDIDQHVFPLGSGREFFERARDGLRSWSHLEIPWLELYGATTPPATGDVVATLVSIAGIWFFNPCRVVYTEWSEDSADVAAFAYGTLPGHAEQGEERFQVSLDAATGEVQYQITAFSRPAVLLSRLGYPMARRLQRRFAKSSAAALARAAA